MKNSLAYGYVRVSTAMQKEDGVSIDTQTAKITEYCKFKDWNLVKIYSDAGLSGKNIERPSLNEVLNVLKKGNLFVVYDLSRFSRNTADAINMLEQIKAKGAFLVCLNPNIDFSSDFGEMMFTVLMAFSTLERKVAAAKTSACMLHLSQQNKLRGRTPFGWKFTSKDLPLEPNLEQQKVIETIKFLHIDKKMNYSNIARYLNEKRLNECLGEGDQIFYAQTIKNILSDHGLIEATVAQKVKNTKDEYNTVKRKPITDRFLNSRRKIDAEKDDKNII